MILTIRGYLRYGEMTMETKCICCKFVFEHFIIRFYSELYMYAQIEGMAGSDTCSNISCSTNAILGETQYPTHSQCSQHAIMQYTIFLDWQLLPFVADSGSFIMYHFLLRCEVDHISMTVLKTAKAYNNITILS